MPTNVDRGPAKIFPFPARGRYAPANHSTQTPAQAYPDFSLKAANHLTPDSADIAYGSSRYHDEAIREAERNRKN